MMRSVKKNAGFTLMELLVSLLILSLIIVGVLNMFDSANHLAKNQVERVNLQQSLRVAQNEMVRMIRLAGRGGLPMSSPSAPLPAQGWGLSVANNVPTATQIINTSSAPEVLEGTDVLTIRGVFSTPVYLVDLEAPAYSLDTTNKKGTLVIQNTTPIGGQMQDLDALCDMLASNRPEALLLVSAYDDRLFGTVQIDYNTSISAGCPDAATQVTLGFTYEGTTYTTEYAKMSSDGRNHGVFPETFMEDTEIGMVGILEEYRFYLRESQQMEDDGLGQTIYKLSRARTYPGIEEAYDADDSNLRVDVAENVIDFQVSFAFDNDGDGLSTESADGEGDEVLYNGKNDDPTTAPWPDLLADAAQRLLYLRLTTLARTFDVDRSATEPPIPRLEDHDYSTYSPFDPVALVNHRLTDLRYPRIVFRTNVEMRNL